MNHRIVFVSIVKQRVLAAEPAHRAGKETLKVVHVKYVGVGR
jgi:hypothetical protein